MASVLSGYSFIFNPPAPGKPDPTLPFPGEGVLDTRRRVVQKPSNGTCVQGVNNMLRIRYRGSGSVELEGRLIEKRVSLYRKKITRITAHMPRIFYALEYPENEELRSFIRGITIDHITGIFRTPTLFSRFLEGVSLLCSESIGLEDLFHEEMMNFSKQTKYDNLLDYLVTLRARREYRIYRRFLRQLKMFPGKAYSQDPPCSCGKCLFTPWKDLPIQTKALLSGLFVERFTAQLFNLTRSEWTPYQSVDALIAEIERVGPLAVGGTFGRSYYPSESLLVMDRKINGRSVYYFKKGTMIKKDGMSGHKVLIVGAERRGNKGFVFFIDPNDVSDPEHPESQRIYCTSYKTLQESISDLRGRVRTYRSGFQSPYGYAHYGPVRPLL